MGMLSSTFSTFCIGVRRFENAGNLTLRDPYNAARSLSGGWRKVHAKTEVLDGKITDSRRFHVQQRQIFTQVPCALCEFHNRLSG
jgi:hypothetical protein